MISQFPNHEPIFEVLDLLPVCECPVLPRFLVLTCDFLQAHQYHKFITAGKNGQVKSLTKGLYYILPGHPSDLAVLGKREVIYTRH